MQNHNHYLGFLFLCYMIPHYWIISSWHFKTTQWSQNAGNQLTCDMASYAQAMKFSFNAVKT